MDGLESGLEGSEEQEDDASPRRERTTKSWLTVLTLSAGALGLSALVLWEVEPQRAVPQRLGDLAQIVHQVPAQRVVQQGIPQRGRRAEVVPRHRGAETKGRTCPLTHHTATEKTERDEKRPDSIESKCANESK